MALGAAAIPGVAIAQTVTPLAPPSLAPALPATVAPPAPGAPGVPVAPPPPATLSAPAIGGAHPLANVDKTKSYYLFFQQQIDLNTTKSLRNYLVQLVEEGASDITIVINSNGALVMPALNLYSLIRALPTQIKTHGQNFVQSAANIIFLAGAERSADADAKFLFHPSQAQIFGLFNSMQSEDQLRQINDVEATLAGIYKGRTGLADADLAVFRQRSIVYDADAALKNGIVQRVGDLQIPGDKKAKLVFVD